MATKQTDSGPEPEGHERAEASADSPHLDAQERKQAATHSQIRALVIHEVLREEGEFELSRPPGALAWSGLAAGLSMGFSFLTHALFQANLPTERGEHVIAAFRCCVGFVTASSNCSGGWGCARRGE